MRNLIYLCSCWLIWGASSVAQSDDIPVTADRVDQLVNQLGASTFSEREGAASELARIGPLALPRLRAAAKSDPDIEIRVRAEVLIRRIMSLACLSPSTKLRLAYIGEGEFKMGSPPKESDRFMDEAQHRVRISRPFLLGTREVTQQQFIDVMGFNPSWFAPGAGGGAKIPGVKWRELPVEQVSWFDAIAFCNRLSVMDGLKPYYRLQHVRFEGNAIVAADVSVAGGLGYRLPTEAEWEYACRTGSGEPYQFGLAKKNPKGNFRYRRSISYGTSTKVISLERTAVVASYHPNPWGLNDLHGNVAEWCWDWYDKDYATPRRAYYSKPKAVVDPLGPATGRHRVARGGSWLSDQSGCRAAARFWQAPETVKYYTGFRVARFPAPEMVRGR